MMVYLAVAEELVRIRLGHIFAFILRLCTRPIEVSDVTFQQPGGGEHST